MREIAAWHYDGESGTRHDVALALTDAGLEVRGAGADMAAHGWADLVARPSRGGARVFGLADRPGWQIGIDGDLPTDFAARFPRPLRYGGVFDRLGFLPTLSGGVLMSLAILSGALASTSWIAQNIPMDWEKRLGRGAIGELTQRECRSSGSQEAMAELAKRLGAPSYVRIHIVDLPLVNAFALPGGEVVIFDGLLRQAQSPDEIAGVLAHELGHVHHRDTSQSLVRQVALRLVLGGMGGDMSSGLSMFMSASHSREAEAAADGYAIDMLKTARISPAGTAGFFDRLGTAETVDGKQPTAMAAFVSSHPVTFERKARFLGAVQPGVRYSPAVEEGVWFDLVDACKDRRAAQLPGFPASPE